MVNIIDSPYQVFSSFFIWILGLFILNFLGKRIGLTTIKSLSIYLWHTFFAFVYMVFSFYDGADSIGYYYAGVYEKPTFSLGTHFIEVLCMYLYNLFNLSYLGIFLIFNIFGTIGLLAFFGALSKVVLYQDIFYRRLAFFVILLPSISFWSVAIGKDSIAFMSVGLALWALQNLEKRLKLMLFAIIIMFFIRPHIATIMTGSLLLVFLFNQKNTLVSRVFLILSGTIIFIFMSNIILRKFNIEMSSVSSVLEYIELRQTYNQNGGGGIDISSMNIIEQLFTYIFRPLPFEAHSISSFLASIDNLLLLFLFIYFITTWFRNKIDPKYKQSLIFIYSFVLVSSVILASTTANLGIAVRQKWMFMPFLIYLWFLYIAGKRKVKKSIDKEINCEK